MPIDAVSGLCLAYRTEANDVETSQLSKSSQVKERAQYSSSTHQLEATSRTSRMAAIFPLMNSWHDSSHALTVVVRSE